MGWLILGVLLWSFTHTFKRWAPDARGRMGNAAKGVVALASLGAIALMVIGYRAAEPVELWSFGSWATPVNNLLMVIAVVLFGLGFSKSRLRGWLRHPMLSGALVWAVAHLLVNGDVPSLVLFGGLGAWAVAAIMLINRSEPAPEPFTGGSIAGDIRLFILSAVILAIIVAVHTWIGPSPFVA